MANDKYFYDSHGNYGGRLSDTAPGSLFDIDMPLWLAIVLMVLPFGILATLFLLVVFWPYSRILLELLLPI